jgi:hypothetical protein
MKQLQHASETSETHETYACNIKKGREREVQSEKLAPGRVWPLSDLVVSRAKVEHRSDAGVDNGHNLLVGNNDVGSTLTRARDEARRAGRGPGTT